MPAILHLPADSLSSFYDAIQTAREFLRQDAEEPLKKDTVAQKSHLWFRGQGKSGHNPWKKYTLSPNILRGTYISSDFLRLHLKEDYRFQHFPARSYHIIKSKPDNNIEWQEIMQHHMLKTRLIDWSEKPTVALLFALLPFIDTQSAAKRPQADPVVWMLNPARLNDKVYTALRDRTLIEEALSDMNYNVRDRKKVASAIYNRMANKESYLEDADYMMSNIISLSRLENMRALVGERMPNLLKNNQVNPFYYLLLRVYSDGIQTDKEIPPLAMIHPSHSERIAMQQGAFTIFPFPSRMQNHRAMEQIPECAECICEIYLTNPSRIAVEMIEQGFTITDLYPELENYARVIEGT